MSDDMGNDAGQSGAGESGQSVDEMLAAPVDPKPKGRMVALWAGVIALLAAALFAVANLAGSEGSKSPEDAVRALFTAAGNEDVLGGLATLAPSERGMFSDDLLGILDELKRLEVLSDDFDAGKVAGVDLEFTDLELAEKPVGEGVTAVTVTGGTAKGSVTPSKLPLGDLVKENLDEELSSETDTTTEPLAEDEPFDIVTIRENGDWFVSIAYTAAEAMRKETGKAAPKFGEHGIEAKGSDTPEAATEAFIRAAIEFDPDAVLALLPPGEGRVFRDYAPLFISDLRDGAKELGDTFSIDLSKIELESEGRGTTSLVTVKSFVADADADGEQTHVEYDGECFTVVSGGGQEEQCADDAVADLGPLGTILGSSGPLNSTLSLVAVEEGGKWYVSPFRSILHPFRKALEDVTKEQMQDLIDFFTGSGMSTFSAEGELVERHTIEGSSGTHTTMIEPGGVNTYCEGDTIDGYNEDEFNQLSPQEQQDAYDRWAARCGAGEETSGSKAPAPAPAADE
jgi:hypothetical protein